MTTPSPGPALGRRSPRARRRAPSTEPGPSTPEGPSTVDVAGAAPNRGRGSGIGGEVEERRQHLGTRDPVDDGVVDLGHDADPTVRQALAPHGTPTAAGCGRAGARPGRPPARRARWHHPAPAGWPAARGSRGRSRGPPRASGAAGRREPRPSACGRAAPGGRARRPASGSDGTPTPRAHRRGRTPWPPGCGGGWWAIRGRGTPRPVRSAGSRGHRPVDPKPSRPRSDPSSEATSTNRAVSTRWSTSWAMRSPRRTRYGTSGSVLTSRTASSSR